MARMRKCICDGTEYEYCPDCTKFSNAPTWKASFCSEKCRNIYNTVEKFAFKYIDAETALEMLKENGLKKSDADKYINSIPKHIKTIFEADVPAVESTPAPYVEKKKNNNKWYKNQPIEELPKEEEVIVNEVETDSSNGFLY